MKMPNNNTNDVEGADWQVHNGRSAELHSAVSRICNPLGTGRPGGSLAIHPCRMQFGDTADCKSALRR